MKPVKASIYQSMEYNTAHSETRTVVGREGAAPAPIVLYVPERIALQRKPVRIGFGR